MSFNNNSNNSHHLMSGGGDSSSSNSKILTLKSMHGLNTKVKNNIWFLDESNLVYPAGRTLVFHNINGTQTYVKGSKDSLGITALALVPNRKYIAVAEKGKQYPTITFYETQTRKKKKIITHSDAGSQEFVSFAFSSDGKFMIAQAGGPHYKLILWSMEGKSRVVATVGTSTNERDPVYQCSMSPDNRLICVTGNGIFKLFKYEEASLKLVTGSLMNHYHHHNHYNQSSSGSGNSSKRDHQTMNEEYMCHSWLDENRLVVSNRNGDLFIVDNTEFKCMIPSAPSDGKAIRTILPYNKGFVCGSDNGSVYIYEPSNTAAAGPSDLQNDVSNGMISQNELYRRHKNLRITNTSSMFDDDNETSLTDLVATSTVSGELHTSSHINGDNNNNNTSLSTTTTNNTADGLFSSSSNTNNSNSQNIMEELHKVYNFAMSPSSETLAITTSTGQIFTLNLTSSDILQEQDVKFYYLTCSFHSQKIYGLDTCIRKPLITTCSMDGTIRIWNYLENSLVAVKKFPTEVYSVAMHPNGLHLVVGFQDKLRFMNILGNDIREAKSFHVRNCPEVKFSHGGQYFAAVHGNVINIYCTHTLVQLHSLRGHSGKIRCLHWLSDDTRIVSAGMDGAVYEYELNTEKRIVHNFNKSCEYTWVTHEGKSIFAAGTDKVIREFQAGELVAQHSTGECAVASMAIAPTQKMMFGGMSDGGIRVSFLQSSNNNNHNNNNSSTNNSNNNNNSISSLSTGLETIVDELYCHGDSITRLKLVHDETILVSVSEEGLMCIFEVRDREGSRLKKDTRYSEEILIAQSDLEEKNNLITELKAKVIELKSDNEYEQKKKALEYNERLKDQSTNYHEELIKKDEKITHMKSVIDQTRSELEMKIEELAEEHILELSKKEKECQDKITSFMQQIQLLKSEFVVEREEMMEKMRENEDEHQAEIAKLTEAHEDEMVAQRTEYEKLKQQFDEKQRDFMERMKQMEEDRDREIEKIKFDFTEKAKQLQQSISMLSGERKTAQTEREKIQNSLNEQKKILRDMNNKLQSTKEKKEHFENEASNLKNENREREETIVDKEKKIFELKRQNQELEKFKFVLQYKITTLEEEIRPNKEQINKLRHEMKQMEKELDRFKELNEEKVRISEDLKSQIAAKNQEITRLRNKLKDAEVFKSRIRSEIHDVVQNIQEPKRLKEEINNLYQKHVNKSIKKQEMDYDIQKEYDRQRSYLEKTVESLKKKLVKATETSKTETNRVMYENMELIKEINILRKDVRVLNSKLREKEEMAGGSGGGGGTGSRSKISSLNSGHSSPKSASYHQLLLQSSSSSTNHLHHHHNQHNGPIELTLEEAKRNIEMQKITIRNLRDRIEELEAMNRASSRPISREKLPPMEGFQPSLISGSTTNSSMEDVL